MSKKQTAEKPVEAKPEILSVLVLATQALYRVGALSSMTLHRTGGDKKVTAFIVEGATVLVVFEDGCIESLHRSAVSILYKAVK